MKTSNMVSGESVGINMLTSIAFQTYTALRYYV
jgi:hypothetical protein